MAELIDGPVRLDPSRPELPPAALAARRAGVGHGMCHYPQYARLAEPAPRPVDEHPPAPARADLPGWLLVALVVAAVVALAAVAIGGVR